MIGRCLILLLISCESLAQAYVGPNYQAIGSTGAALQGINSLTANPAGLVGVKSFTAGVYYQPYFFSDEVSTQTAVLGVPTRLGCFGVVLNRFGLKTAYSDSKIGFSFAKRLSPQIALGLLANYHQLYIPSYANETALSVDVGMQYSFPQGAMIGLQYSNVGNTNYGQVVYGTIPAHLAAGVSYPWLHVLATAEMVYRFAEGIGGNFGVEYNIGDLVFLRGGISINPFQQHAGFGLCWPHFIFDTAVTFHPYLGATPQIGLCYAF